jgi:hypothetical protein
VEQPGLVQAEELIVVRKGKRNGIYVRNVCAISKEKAGITRLPLIFDFTLSCDSSGVGVCCLESKDPFVGFSNQQFMLAFFVGLRSFGTPVF